MLPAKRGTEPQPAALKIPVKLKGTMGENNPPQIKPSELFLAPDKEPKAREGGVSLVGFYNPKEEPEFSFKDAFPQQMDWFHDDQASAAADSKDEKLKFQIVQEHLQKRYPLQDINKPKPLEGVTPEVVTGFNVK